MVVFHRRCYFYLIDGSIIWCFETISYLQQDICPSPPDPPLCSFHLNPTPSQLLPGLTHSQPIRAGDGFVSTNQERESIARSSNDVRVGSVCLLGPEREGKSPLGVVGNEATW